MCHTAFRSIRVFPEGDQKGDDSMKEYSLKQTQKKIKHLEKEYESTPDAAVLTKQKIEKRMRKLLVVEQDLKGYKKGGGKP